MRKTKNILHKKGRKIAIVTLGCARNLVDSQEFLGRLQGQGHAVVDVSKANTVIVNTCTFVEEAKQESIEVIMDLLDLKKRGKIERVIVTGCLAQRYAKELAEEFKNVDAIIGVPKFAQTGVAQQVSLTPDYYAYLKICESCFNHCAFCVIPKIKGKFSSRRMASVVDEFQQLDRRGVREVNIIGQDITAYGMDIYKKKSLARLLKKIARSAESVEWIRLLYTFPSHITDELISVIAREDKICKYIDVPLQHISGRILRNMQRKITPRQIKTLIQKLRREIPNVRLRTTFIVGLPGETKDDFSELLDFVQETRFEKVGCFVYSREEGTPAYHMPQQVAAVVKMRRQKKLMEAQKRISNELLRSFIGKRIKVMIQDQENKQEKLFVGRTEYDAPDVDGNCFVRSKRKLKPGDFVSVRIQDAYEYDLIGDHE